MTPYLLFSSLSYDIHGKVVHNLAVLPVTPVVGGEEVDEVKVFVEGTAEVEERGVEERSCGRGSGGCGVGGGVWGGRGSAGWEGDWRVWGGRGSGGCGVGGGVEGGRGSGGCGRAGSC